MKIEVSTAIEELKRQFATATFTASEDGQGGARVLIEPVAIGPRYSPSNTWLGFQIPAQYPYADIYPIFIGIVTRVDQKPFLPPVTPGHSFEGRSPFKCPDETVQPRAGFKRQLPRS